MGTPAVWGPTLWKVLHGIGHTVTHAPPTTDLLTRDRIRETTWLLTHLSTIIPCAECRRHLIDYIHTHPLPTAQSDVAVWIWNFHEAVNSRLGKEGGPSYTPELGKVDVLVTWNTYKSFLKDSIASGKQKGSAVLEYSRHLLLWKACM
jgi:hypothetical protein